MYSILHHSYSFVLNFAVNKQKRTMELLKKIDEGLSYSEYIAGLERQLKKNPENDKMLNYVYLNLKRMKRIEKQYEVAPYLSKLVQKIDLPVTWLVITEGWCGDAAHVLPVLNHMSELSFKPKLKIILRDEHPELMDKYLTNGARSIPKVLAVDKNGEVVSMWGPRPSSAQKIVEDYKNGESEYASYDELSVALQKWYHYNKYTQFESEIVDFIEPQIRAKEAVTV